MKTPLVAIAMSALPLASFGAAYSFARIGHPDTGTSSTRPRCTGGRQRAMDGWSCTDWKLIDPATGKVSTGSVD